MTKARWIELLAVFAVLGFLLWQDHSHAQAHYRRDLLVDRTLLNLQRNLDGVIEQADSTELELGQLETRLLDLFHGVQPTDTEER